MNKLKYRLWSVKAKRMRILDPYDDRFPFSSSDLVEDEDRKVMEFTTLFDKNRKEIYEGDILSSGEAQGVMDWVVYNNTAAWAMFAPLHLFEVIGNIWENPELVNKED